MIDAVDSAATKKANFICNFRQMGPVLSQVRSALAIPPELEWTLNIVPLAALHRRLLLSFAHKLLEVHLGQHRFGIKGVNMRGATLHHQKDDVLGLGREMPRFRSERIGFCLVRKQ